MVDRRMVDRQATSKTPTQELLQKIIWETRVSRVHTPCTLSICRFLHRVMLTISASPVEGMVNGHGFDGPQIDATCDVRGSCLMI